MAKLLYSAIASLDGCVEDASGRFDWAEPDEEVHTFVNDLMRGVGTHLYGRGMYETMVFWQDVPDLDGQPEYIRRFAELWQGADKVVFSRTLQGVSTPRTRLEPAFDADAVRELKRAAAGDLVIGGPTLAAAAIAAGLVDEYHLFLVPVLVGGGKRALPARGARVRLELLDERRFRNGTVYLRYGAVR